MESENLDRITEKSEEESRQDKPEEEKSNKDDNEKSEKNDEKEDNPQNNQNQKENTTIIDPYIPSKFTLKYKRTEEQLKELSIETKLPKNEICQFMLYLNIIKKENSDNILIVNFHEIAAIYFDEIYEKEYTLSQLCDEIKFFKVFDTIEEAKNIIDESMRKNEKNKKKIFIDFNGKIIRLHMILSFFDKEKEIIFNIPQKILSIEDKNNLLPNFLKEIQNKMNCLKEENNKLRALHKIDSDTNILEIENQKDNQNDYDNEAKSINSKGQKKKVIKKKKILKQSGKEEKKSD